METGSLALYGFDPARGVYAKAKLFSPFSVIDGFEIYGLNLEITDFSAFAKIGRPSEIRITGAGSVRIVSARISSYSFERCLGARYPALENPEVRVDRTIRFFGARGGREVYGELSLVTRPPVLNFSLDNFSYGGYTLPRFMLGVFRFNYTFSGLPCDILFNRIQLSNQMLEIS